MDATSGLVVVDKPAGMTSHQVVGRVRRVLGTRRVGHAGTLDPMATGVLVIGVNRATRLLGHLALHDKEYRATIRLGQSTTTDDAEGEPTGGAPAGSLGREEIESAIAGLRGEIMQVPSTVSAIRVDGRRAYARARAGEDVRLAARPVQVSRFEATSVASEDDLCDVEVEVECSSGTYVRALARDLGAALGVGGHLTRLRRTRVGHYGIDAAISLDALEPATPLISMADAARLSFPVVEVGPDEARDIGFGRRLAIVIPASPTGVIGPDGDLLALYAAGGRPMAVFA